MEIEICTFSVESCLNAQQAGADRVELCGGLYEGGTTPSYGLIKHAREILNISLYVMVRPRGGDFCYDAEELQAMIYDIEVAKELGADGVVLGILLPDGRVDVANTKKLVELAQPMGVTFHRAFDRTIDPFEALENVIETGCERILTSGQAPSAIEGKDMLGKLVKQAAGRIEIMAGAGVNATNAFELATTGVQALHLTAKALRKGRMTHKPSGVEMSSIATIPDDSIVYSSIDQIVALKKAIEK